VIPLEFPGVLENLYDVLVAILGVATYSIQTSPCAHVLYKRPTVSSSWNCTHHKPSCGKTKYFCSSCSFFEQACRITVARLGDAPFWFSCHLNFASCLSSCSSSGFAFVFPIGRRGRICTAGGTSIRFGFRLPIVDCRLWRDSGASRTTRPGLSHSLSTPLHGSNKSCNFSPQSFVGIILPLAHRFYFSYTLRILEHHEHLQNKWLNCKLKVPRRY
jgi:hypothetical protein